MLMKNFLLKTACLRAPMNQRATSILALQFRCFNANSNNKGGAAQGAIFTGPTPPGQKAA
jgi:hypothetical protein